MTTTRTEPPRPVECTEHGTVITHTGGCPLCDLNTMERMRGERIAYESLPGTSDEWEMAATELHGLAESMRLFGGADHIARKIDYHGRMAERMTTILREHNR